MKVHLIDYTENAKELLIFTKQTRRMQSGSAFDDIMKQSDEWKDNELDYVFKTISSPWEFVRYVFLIEGVTRAFTHQLVRHRVGTSFAQQAQRIAKMENFQYLATGECEKNEDYHDAMLHIQEGYDKMISEGVPTQDARGVLPTNILTNICFGVNLRSIAGIMEVRLCVRAQGEFQKVAFAIREEILKVHPFAAKVLKPGCLQGGSCIFPAFDDCPVSQNSPWLRNSLNPEAMAKPEADWAELSQEHEPQPE